jgi:phage-related protein
MDNLPIGTGINVSFGSSHTRKARVLSAAFGNGYQQRAADGINNVRGTYSVVFTNLTRAEANTMDAFFTAKAGYLAFLYQPPGYSTPKMWTCSEWSRQHVDGLIDNISATFEEVFTP